MGLTFKDGRVPSFQARPARFVVRIEDVPVFQLRLSNDCARRLLFELRAASAAIASGTGGTPLDEDIADALTAALYHQRLDATTYDGT